MKKIIGLTGPAGSGKDTVAGLLVEHAGFHKFAFADSLRVELARAFSIGIDDLLRRETKEHPITALALKRCDNAAFVEHVQIADALHGRSTDTWAPRSPRWAMQQWGDYRRKQSANYWLKAMRHKLVEHLMRPSTAHNATWNHIVITDCRRQNEVDFLRCMGGMLLQIRRPDIDVEQGAHASETSGADFDPDLLINNNSDLDRLKTRTLNALHCLYPDEAHA